MGYREVRRMELQEVVRRWQAGGSQRAIGRALGLARMTVEKYVHAAMVAGLRVHGPPPTEDQAVALGRANRPGRAPGGPAPQQARLAPYQEQIAHWVREERLQLTRVQELLARQGVVVPYTTLRRFRDVAGLGRRSRTTVRLPEWPPGEAAELDFGRLGGVAYVQERFWKGGSFTELADARGQATQWCREVAGQRVHGTTRRLPLVVFQDEEQRCLTPLAQTPYGQQQPDHPDAPYDVPLWRAVTVHADHHVSFQYALYSAPASTCPPETKLEVRGDRDLVKLYRRGELVHVHPRQPAGGRHTDPADYPPERATYATRAPDRLVQQAVALGVHVGTFATRLLDGPAPWAKLRQGQKLLRLAERYTAARLDAACARALGFDLLDVR